MKNYEDMKTWVNSCISKMDGMILGVSSGYVQWSRSGGGDGGGSERSECSSRAEDKSSRLESMKSAVKGSKTCNIATEL